jgi:hypothetical protein
MDRTLEAVSDDLDLVDKGFDPDQAGDSGNDNEKTKSHENAHLWLKHLSGMETSLIHLARALIMNPEVLVLQKPLSSFGQVKGRKVCEVLITNVRERGLCLPEDDRTRRRPRTMFLSAVDQNRWLSGADVIWRLEPCGKMPHPCRLAEITQDVRTPRISGFDSSMAKNIDSSGIVL